MTRLRARYVSHDVFCMKNNTHFLPNTHTKIHHTCIVINFNLERLEKVFIPLKNISNSLKLTFFEDKNRLGNFVKVLQNWTLFVEDKIFFKRNNEAIRTIRCAVRKYEYTEPYETCPARDLKCTLFNMPVNLFSILNHSNRDAHLCDTRYIYVFVGLFSIEHASNVKCCSW